MIDALNDTDKDRYNIIINNVNYLLSYVYLNEYDNVCMSPISYIMCMHDWKTKIWFEYNGDEHTCPYTTHDKIWAYVICAAFGAIGLSFMMWVIFCVSGGEIYTTKFASETQIKKRTQYRGMQTSIVGWIFFVVVNWIIWKKFNMDQL